MIFKQNKTINYYFTIFLLFSLIFIKFINSGVHTVPETDEIVSITTFTDIRTLFLKYIPNNHFFSSLFGTLLTNIFGLNLIILRSVSYLFIFFSFIYICKKNENISKTLIILLLFLLNPLIVDYSFLYRGYAFSTFLFVLLFYQITIIYKNDQSSKIALLILSFLIFHSLSNIYVVVPTLLLIIFFLYKNKKLSNLKFFFIPCIILFFTSIVITGIYLNKDQIIIEELSFFLITQNFFKLFIDGFFAIFFPDTGSLNIFSNFDKFFVFLFKNKIFSIVFFVALLKSIYFLFKRKYLIDLTIIFFLISLLLVNKIPPERVLTSYYLFFILYLVFDIKNLKLFNYRIINILLFSVIVIIIFNLKFYKSSETHLVKDEILKKIVNVNCKLNFTSNNEFEYHYFYYIYLTECRKKPDIFEFYNFYKTRKINLPKVSQIK